MLIRALAASILCKEKTIIRNFTLCDDAESAMNIIKSLGAEVVINKHKMQIAIKHVNKTTRLHCGESALCLRIFTPVVAFFSDDFEVSGKNTLLNRNINDLLKALNLFGLQCENREKLPVRVTGKINGGEMKIDAGGTSQTLSGLLTILPLCNENSVIDVENLHSKPYIDLTISILEKFGIKIINEDYKRFFIEGNQTYKACRLNVEGDWSGASCLLAAAATVGSITIENLNSQSKQADVAMLDVLRLCGAEIMIKKNKITVKKNQLNAFEFDATDCPDLFPAIVALASSCKGTSIVRGALRLQNKESDRAEILKGEFAKLNIKIDIENNVMYICGGNICASSVNSHGDHRIAMALAAASACASGNIIIENAECVAKSYPDFWIDFSKVTNQCIVRFE
jgi:3-phosphoshikimate 1-carboxyvinyltransferase